MLQNYVKVTLRNLMRQKGAQGDALAHFSGAVRYGILQHSGKSGRSLRHE